METRLFLSSSRTLVLALALLSARSLCAQVVSDGAINTLDNVTNTFAGDVTVGTNGSFTLLILTNNALLTNSGHGYLGRNAGANSNRVWLTGANTRWLMGGDLYVGNSGAFNRLVISNGALVGNSNGYVGYDLSSSNNEALVTGTNSFWSNRGNLSVGDSGSGNRLVISNGGLVGNGYGYLGYNSSSSNNVVLVTGAGSFWSNGAGLHVGSYGSGNRLVISNGGTVSSSTAVYLGFDSSSSNNLLTVGGGSLIVTNPAGSGVLDIRRGTNVLNAGLIDVDRLLLTNARSIFEFNGGTLRTKGTTNNNGRLFTAGNGTSAATFQLLGGTHTFANNLLIASNATLSGNGTIFGNVTNFGTISAGASAGSLRINGSLSLAASAGMVFEIGGLIPTNQYDQIIVTNFVQFAGTLSLTLINNFLPDDSDTFTLLKFASSSGYFTNAPFAGRVSTTNGLASFAVTYTATNLVLGDVQYVDSDGDGQGDLEEQAAGTDPNNSREFLTITSITRDVLGRYAVQFQSMSNKLYRVDWSANLNSAWSTVLGPSFTAPATNLTQWIDDGTLTAPLTNVTARFYRIGLQ